MILSVNAKPIKCVICKEIIIGQYTVDNWGNTAHTIHNHRPTEFCNSCFRILDESRIFKSTTLPDGRKLCFQCSLSKVDSIEIAKKSFRAIKDLYIKFNLNNISDSVKIELVHLPEMKRISNSNSNHTRGTTICQYSLLANQRRYAHTIYLLMGLPKLEFEAVLAHEMLHVFLNENNISLPYNKMEGFCNLGAYLIYARDKSKHGQVMLTHMERNPDIAYGVTFREMKSILLKSGWRELINKIS